VVAGTVTSREELSLELEYPPIGSDSVWRTTSAYEGWVEFNGVGVMMDC